MSEGARAQPYRLYLAENGAGLAGSALLHLTVLLLIVAFFNPILPAPARKLRSVLVDIVQLGAETTSPQATQTAAMPQQEAFARHAPEAHSPPTGVAPRGTKPPDDLENRLNALSKLRAPETDTRTLIGAGTSRAPSASSDAAQASDATYSLRDFVRAQIERRWNLDLSLLGTRDWSIALHVVMKSSGKITDVQIVDKHRYTTDAIFRQIAMSARNAVLLSSPIALPAGNYPAETEMTLKLDPRDVVR